VRRRQKGIAQYEKLADERDFFPVREGGLRFLVNLVDYLDTGLFLDDRLLRARIRELAAGRDVLNLFCYTGAATVYAAAGGARSTTSVDLSNTYLDWAARNLDQNGFSVGREHELVRADVLRWLEEAPRRRYGLAFVAPPTFSRSKSMDETFDVQRDHVALLERVAEHLTDDGVLVFATNFRRFKLDAAALAPLAAEDIGRKSIPPDFARDPRVHAAWILRRPS
jgi:23S rRNA (guanine2445-N2)-methyltransferase / 23S rRNA (guanine2069-N7)-methyltransferase